MESTPSTAPSEATIELPVVDAPAAVPAPLSIAADSCAACGAHLATDQRYCVECGQSRGASRLPAPRAAPAPASPGPQPSRWSANAALIAGIGTLVLAMGIGVFIGSQGRTDTSGTVKTPAGQTVTVISAGGGAAPSAAAGGPATAAPTAGGAAGSTAAAAAAKAPKKAGAAAPVQKKPTPPVVHVGTPGTGPGYQNGKFTGNFF